MYEGAQIVTLVLNDESLFKQWGEDLTVMSGRIKSMRHSLYSELKELQTPGTWEHIINQVSISPSSRSFDRNMQN